MVVSAEQAPPTKTTPNIWFSKDSILSWSNNADGTDVLVAFGALVFAVILFVGIIFISFKIALAMYGFFNAIDNPMDQMKYKQDLKEVFTYSLYLIGMTVTTLTVAYFVFPTSRPMLSSFWYSLTHSMKLFGVGK